MRQAVGFRDRTTVDAQKMVAQLDLAQHAVLIKVLKHKHRSDIHRHAKSNVLSFLSFRKKQTQHIRVCPAGPNIINRKNIRDKKAVSILGKSSRL
jgi:hypothetical protein